MCKSSKTPTSSALKGKHFELEDNQFGDDKWDHYDTYGTNHSSSVYASNEAFKNVCYTVIVADKETEIENGGKHYFLTDDMGKNTELHDELISQVVMLDQEAVEHNEFDIMTKAKDILPWDPCNVIRPMCKKKTDELCSTGTVSAAHIEYDAKKKTEEIMEKRACTSTRARLKQYKEL